MEARPTWKMMRKVWVDLNAGAPDYITSDAGTNFSFAKFKEDAASMGSIARNVPTKAHDEIGIIELNHGYLRTVYGNLRIDLPQVRREELLATSFRVIHDAPSSKTGISPTTLASGVYPKISGEGSHHTKFRRANIIRKCTDLVFKIKSCHLHQDAGKIRNMPGIEDVPNVVKLPLGSEVLIY